MTTRTDPGEASPLHSLVGMTEQRKPTDSGTLDEEFASTSNDDHRATADDRDPKAPPPQGGKGTPSQAEGEREAEE